MGYWRRTSRPDYRDPHFTMSSSGGYSPCVQGSVPWWPGSTLSNCVGYVWGRWSEMGYGNTATAYGFANAPSYIKRKAIERGEYSSSPNRGSAAIFFSPIALYSTGHIAIVESWDDYNVYCTESNYGSAVDSNLAWREVTYSRSVVDGYILFPEGGDPGPGPGPDPDPPVATQPIEPEYGPGGQIWLTKVAFSCHYVDSTYVNPDTGAHDVYFHPAMKLLVNGNVVATSKKGIAWGFNLPGQGEYTDIYWASESPDGVKTNDFQIRLNGDHPDADRFDIIGTDPSTNWTYIEYYICSSEEYDESLKPDRAVLIDKEKYTSYFDGAKWTTFKKE